MLNFRLVLTFLFLLAPSYLGIAVPSNPSSIQIATGGPSFLLLSTEVMSPRTINSVSFYRSGAGTVKILVNSILIYTNASKKNKKILMFYSSFISSILWDYKKLYQIT